MRVLISHAYSTENKGDAALLEVLVQDIFRQYGEECSIDILTIDKIEQDSTFAGVRLHEAFMYYALNQPKTRIGKLLYAAYMMVYTPIWAIVYRYLHINLPLPKTWRDIVNLYVSSDMIITVGGGYFRTSGDIVTFINLLLMLHPLRFAEILRKPTFLYTMSVGPFYSSIERMMVARLFRRLPLILIREDTSFALLQKMGIHDNVKRAVDSGFLFASEKTVHLRTQLAIPKNRKIVGVTARQWLNKEKQQAYESEMALALDGIIEKHAVDVVFIPQVTSEHNSDDDRVVSRSIAARMQHGSSVHVMDGDYDHYAVKAMYNELDFIIGTRFHSVIFSLTSKVPAIAIEYEHKTSGIMNDLDLRQWTLKIEDVKADTIEALFDAMVKHRREYIAHLNKVLPDYVARASDAIIMVDESYHNLSV